MQSPSRINLGKKVYHFRMNTISTALIGFFTPLLICYFTGMYFIKIGSIPEVGIGATIGVGLIGVAMLFGVCFGMELSKFIPKIGHQIIHFENGVQIVSGEQVEAIPFNEIIQFQYRPLDSQPLIGKRRRSNEKVVWNMVVSSRKASFVGNLSFKPGSRAERAARSLVAACDPKQRIAS